MTATVIIARATIRRACRLFVVMVPPWFRCRDGDEGRNRADRFQKDGTARKGGGLSGFEEVHGLLDIAFPDFSLNLTRGARILVLEAVRNAAQLLCLRVVAVVGLHLSFVPEALRQIMRRDGDPRDGAEAYERQNSCKGRHHRHHGLQCVGLRQTLRKAPGVPKYKTLRG